MNLDSRAEEQIRRLSDPSNRVVVAALEDAGGPTHLSELAERLVDRKTAVVTASEYDERIERTSLELHHERLPKLDDAGLVEYDPGTNRVGLAGGGAPVVEWEDLTRIDELLEHVDAGRGPGTATRDAGAAPAGVVTGRESAIEYGRRLADEADDELFCMYVDTDLLEDECVCRARSAIDRGVAMYVGSGNPAVRELTRRHLPEATVWEPQLDWLNAPTYPRVCRLVLADRRSVMLAVLEEPTEDGDHPDETALVARGEDHPLVVLVRELLGSRLDHLDYQSEHFRRELPS